MFSKNRQLFLNMNNKTQIKKIKNSLCESIAKNIDCLDYLDNLENSCRDTYNLTESLSDKALLCKVQWIKFQITYLTDEFEKALKKQGGNVNVIQPVKWF